MQPLSQFVLRNAATLGSAQELLWINPPGDAPWRELTSRLNHLELFCQDRSDWRALNAAGAQPQFGALPDSAPTAILLSLPKEKDRLRMLAHWAAAVLPQQGRLWLAGENQAGIRSCERHVLEYFTKVHKHDSARHCGLYEFTHPQPAQKFDPQDWRQDWPLARGEASLTICSWPGVFAHGGLDAGTSLLLEHLPDLKPGQRVLDFGCGAGVVAAALLQAQPKLDCVLADSSALALLSAQATLDANGLQARIVPSDGLHEVEGRFDWVISNPPFHQRHANRPELGTTLLADVRHHLKPSGRLLLVANRHLPWPRWLDQVFGGHRQVADEYGYRVLSNGAPGSRRAAN